MLPLAVRSTAQAGATSPRESCNALAGGQGRAATALGLRFRAPVLKSAVDKKIADA